MERTTVKLRKWGNSFGVTIPLNLIQNQNLKEGSELEITLEPKDKMTVNDFIKIRGKIKLRKVNVCKILNNIDKEFLPEEE